jgi:phosphoenolpyruvate synthase/pyruvate phosphate dikinase
MKYRLNLTYEDLDILDYSTIKGVGLFRSEHIMSVSNEYITQEKCKNLIIYHINRLSNIFPNDEIWYRTFDLSISQVKELNGYNNNISDDNRILGCRGIRHSLKFVDDFKSELYLIKQVINSNKNVHLIFPFISTIVELEYCLKILNELEIKCKFGIMGEIPTTLLFIEDYLALGISNVTIGINDLTTCLLGTSRNKNHNICDKSVLKIVKETIDKCKYNNIPISIAGNMTSDFIKYMKDYDPDYLILHYSEIDLIHEMHNRTTSVWQNWQ